MEFNQLVHQRYGFTYPDAGTGMVLGVSGLNSKGAWVEVSPALPFDCNYVRVSLFSPGSTNMETFVDIGVGASGKETVLLPNLAHSIGGEGNECSYEIPIFIPKDTRVVSRTQATKNAQSMFGNVRFMAASPWDIVAKRLSVYGANIASTSGVQIDPGATIHTKGAVVELGITGGDSQLLWIAILNKSNSVRSDTTWYVDIGIGPPPEQGIIWNEALGCTTVYDCVEPILFGPYAVCLPKGTRLSARAQCSINDATDRLFDMIAYCLEF